MGMSIAVQFARTFFILHPKLGMLSCPRATWARLALQPCLSENRYVLKIARNLSKKYCQRHIANLAHKLNVGIWLFVSDIIECAWIGEILGTLSGVIVIPS